ncbi:hypothetical protein D9M68_747890 [compost metagenome]
MSGSFRRLKRALCSAHGNLPESMMAPPTLLPWPPRYLVNDCTTMSAPCSIGRSRYGDGTVLSTISGRPWRCASSARAAMSVILPSGLPTDSAKMALVRSSICASNDARSDGLAKRVAMPYCGSVCANRL